MHSFALQVSKCQAYFIINSSLSLVQERFILMWTIKCFQKQKLIRFELFFDLFCHHQHRRIYRFEFISRTGRENIIRKLIIICLYSIIFL